MLLRSPLRLVRSIQHPAATWIRPLSTFAQDPIPTSLRPSSSSSSSPHPSKDRRKYAYLYFDSVFPIRIGLYDVRYLFAQVEQASLLSQLRALVPQDSAYNVVVESVVERSKDGGAFVQFSYELPRATEEDEIGEKEEGEMERRVLEVVERETAEAVAGRGYKPWFTFGESRAFLVKGKPWMEDMNRFPNSTLIVSFEGPDLPQEDLWTLFRRFGKIHNIYPPLASSKDLPRSANIQYTSLRSAAAARNCLHAYTVSNPTTGLPTTLRILYAERQHPHLIKEWITSHPRIMLPVIVALLGVVSWAVFDPIRKFFIRKQIDGSWDAKRWRVYGWLKKETLGRLGLGSKAVTTATGIEKERAEAKSLLEQWLREVPDTLIIVTGPRGSGKRSLIEDVVASDTKNVLTIDCDEICKTARTDTKLVSQLSAAVGYWPQFVLAASLNNLIDLAAVSFTGQKAGFSETLDVQLKQILEVTAAALKTLSTQTTERSNRAASKAELLRQNASERTKVLEQLEGPGIRDVRVDAVAGNGILSELGGGMESLDNGHMMIMGPTSASFIRTLSDGPSNHDEAKAAHERLPVVVIRGFSSKGEAKQEVLWNTLAEWAAVLVENQVAHVIFTSDSTNVSKVLAQALPNKPFNTISLTDASPTSSLQFISTKLASTTLLPSDEYYISLLGGRQTDLEALVGKMSSGMGAEEAVEELVERSVGELRKGIFGDDAEEAKGFKWSRAQAWSIVKGLASAPSLKYADTVIQPPFESAESPLRSLESAELITITHAHGRPSLILPGKPLYKTAFARLLEDAVFAATIEWGINDGGIKKQKSELEAAVKGLRELEGLGGTWSGSVETRRGKWREKMRAAEGKLEALENQKKELEAVLKAEV